MKKINEFIYHLKQTKGIGNQSILKLISHCIATNQEELTVFDIIKYGNVRIDKVDLVEKTFLQSINKPLQMLQETGMITILDEDYPKPLKEIYNPPAALFYQGDIKLLKTPSLAVVGSRKATDYGKNVTKSILPELISHNLTIVSGLARGIDTFAHQQTIFRKGKTIAVIGCGLNVSYPSENFRLQKYIGQHHLLVSEYILDSPPLAYHFPTRNRIIAGITAGTCIIEAKSSSGSLITAQLALENGREVFAVPGNIQSEESAGAIELIQQGAKCVRKAQDILEEYPFNCKDFMN